MKLNAINPTRDIYAASNDYIHALEIVEPRRFLFVSGTMGLDKEGTPPPGIQQQLKLVWSNIRTILAEADMGVDNVVRQTSYLRDGQYAEANQNARLAALNDRRIPTTTIIVETLDHDWLVEIEIIAVAS